MSETYIIKIIMSHRKRSARNAKNYFVQVTT